MAKFKPMVNIPKGQTIGSPMKQAYTPAKNPAWAKGKPMSKAAVASRKKARVSNAAGKVMGGLYSK